MLADMMFKPDRKRRPIFPDYTHWLFGYAVIILAWITIYLGLDKIGDTAAWVWTLVSVWMGLVVLTYLILTILRLMKKGEDDHSKKKEEIPNNNNNNNNNTDERLTS